MFMQCVTNGELDVNVFEIQYFLSRGILKKYLLICYNWTKPWIKTYKYRVFFVRGKFIYGFPY